MEFPRFVEIEQSLYARRVADIPTAVVRALAAAGVERRIRRGDRPWGARGHYACFLRKNMRSNQMTSGAATKIEE